MLFHNLVTFWSFVEPLITIPSFLLTFFLFFKDPIRRWRFFGYRPTAILVLYDEKLRKIILVKKRFGWYFVQGGIYESNLLLTSEYIARRELNLDKSHMQLRYLKEMGTVKIKNRYRSNRASIGGVSLFSNIVGKGYIAFFIASDFKRFIKRNKIAYNLLDVNAFTIKQARRIFQNEALSNSVSKSKILSKVLDEAESLFKVLEGDNGK